MRRRYRTDQEEGTCSTAESSTYDNYRNSGIDTISEELDLRIGTVRASDSHTTKEDSSKGSGQGGISRP